MASDSVSESGTVRAAQWECPPGYHFEAVEHAGWETPAVGAGRCRYRVGRFACGRAAVATLWRGRPARKWDYCQKHLYGRWIEDGKVMGWKLVRDKP